MIQEKNIMLKNVTLRNRILIGYAIPVGLSLLTAFIVYNSGVKKVERQTEKVKIRREHIEEVEDLAFSILQMEQSARGYLIGKQKSELKDYEKWDTMFFEQSEKIRPLIEEDEQKKNLNEIIEVGDRMNEFYRRLISYLELGKRNKFISVWNEGKVQSLTDNLTQLLQNFEQKERELSIMEENAQTDALNLLTRVVFGLAVLSGFLALILGIWIASAISKQMNSETNVIASSTSEIAVTIEQQERNSTEQASAVNETTTTINELSMALKQGKQQAEESAINANQALSLAEQGKQAVEQTLKEMEILKNKVIAIADRSIKLQDKSSEIENITRLVSELAVQTNMLALNASIEAVRAGQQGKGFDVVASEIRSLADQSREAADKINKLITDINQDIQTTALVTKEGTTKVEEAVIIAGAMASAFTGVADAVNNVVLNNQQMSLKANEEFKGIEQILYAMEGINQAARENANGAIQVKEGTQKLNESVLNLKAII